MSHFLLPGKKLAEDAPGQKMLLASFQTLVKTANLTTGHLVTQWFKQLIVNWMLPFPSSQKLSWDSSLAVTCSSGVNRMGLQAHLRGLCSYSLSCHEAVTVKKSSFHLPLQSYGKKPMTSLLRMKVNLLNTKSLADRYFFMTDQQKPERNQLWSHSLQWKN